MPEGPEVKTVARTLSERLVGKSLGDVWLSPYSLRKPANKPALQALKNHRIHQVVSFGKVLFIEGALKKPMIVAQLGMTGQLVVCAHDTPVAPHTHVRFGLKDSSEELRYIDPRRFGLIDACTESIKQAILKKLGPDPFLLTHKDYAGIIATMKKSTRAIKEVLLDQSVIAGVGNIYAAEALFLAGINPMRQACGISDKSYKRLIDAVVDVMHTGYKNCGTSFSNYVDGSGNKGSNISFVKVFQRDGGPCTVCQTTIARIKQGGRSTCYCPRCQR